MADGAMVRLRFFRLGLKLDYHDTSAGAVCLDFELDCFVFFLF